MKTDLDIRIQAIVRCRELASQYVEGKMDWLLFWQALPKNFAPFDPLDWSLDDLDDAQKEEILFYFQWHGGEFGEHEDRIPRKRDWKYGDSDEPYGWVDRDRYHKEFSEAFGELKKGMRI